MKQLNGLKWIIYVVGATVMQAGFDSQLQTIRYLHYNRKMVGNYLIILKSKLQYVRIGINF